MSGWRKKSLVHTAQFLQDFWKLGNFHKICSVTLTSTRHTNLSCIKYACHWPYSSLAGIVYTFVGTCVNSVYRALFPLPPHESLGMRLVWGCFNEYFPNYNEYSTTWHHKLVEQCAKHCLSVLVLFRLCYAYVEKVPGSSCDTHSRSGRAWKRGYFPLFGRVWGRD